MRKQYYIGVPSIVVLSLLPVLFWFLQTDLSRHNNFTLIMRDFGQITGLVGITMFALTIILSGRYKWMENYFGGLNRIYIVHHALGALAFLLILIHPMMLVAGRLAVSVRFAVSLYIPSTDWGLDLGRVALAIMIVLLAITLYAQIRYNIWKSTHTYLDLVFIFAFFHSLLSGSNMRGGGLLEYYLIILSSLAVLTMLYRRRPNKNIAFAVRSIGAIGNNITAITLQSSTGVGMSYAPGQFIFIKFDTDSFRESHPFSIVSAPSDKEVSIWVKSLGDYTNRIREINIGTSAKVEGPYGKFIDWGGAPANMVWVAGGIGVAPFVSMAKSLPAGRRADLFYSYDNSDDEKVVAILTRIKKANVRIIPWNSKKMGYINAGCLVKYSGELKGKEFYICGPPPMMKSLRKQLSSSGVANNEIHTEEFVL